MNPVILKYCGILSTRLDRFKVKTTRPRYKANCRCPICGDSKKNQNTSADDVAKEGKELMETSKKLVQEKYTEFTDSISLFRTYIQQKMSNWEEKTENMSTGLKKDYRTKLNQLEAKQSALDEKIKEYENAADSKKDELIEEVRQLQDALKKSADTFEQEIQNNQ